MSNSKMDIAEFINDQFSKTSQKVISLQEHISETDEYQEVMRLTNKGIANYLAMIHDEKGCFDEYWKKQSKLFDELHKYRHIAHLTDMMYFADTFGLVSLIKHDYLPPMLFSKTGYLLLLNSVLSAVHQQLCTFNQLDSISKPLAEYTLTLKDRVSDEGIYDQHSSADLSKLIEQALTVLKSYL